MYDDGIEAPAELRLEKPERERERLTRSMADNAVTYREVGGDREFNAFDVYAGARYGRYQVREPADAAGPPGTDLVITVDETGETYRVREVKDES